MKKRSILLIFLVTVHLTGCSGMPVVQYTPHLTASGAKNASVWVKDFEDDRSPYEKEVLGGVYNAHNMRFGDIKAPQDLVQSIRKAFVLELKNAGYRIVDNNKDIMVLGTIQSILCDSKTTKSCEMQIQVAVVDKGEEVLKRAYRGKSQQFVSFAVDCSQPLNKSLEKIVTDFVLDLNEYLKT